METKHTQGKWVIEPHLNSFSIQSEKNRICNLFAHSESEANAKLIAAAPELLDALIFSNMFPITSEKDRVEAAKMAKQLGWKIDMPLEHFEQQVKIEAIKKATK